MITRITLKRLPLENLKRKPFRTAALVIVVMMLTLAFFGGSLLSMNLRNGLRSMQERMGPDGRTAAHPTAGGRLLPS